MTLDEAIKYEEEVADKYENACRREGTGSGAEKYIQNYRQFRERHRQFAKWLKELKACREVWSKIKEQIDEEANFAYADFDKYKCEVLGVDADELPDDDFRFGMGRAYEIINEHISDVESDVKE